MSFIGKQLTCIRSNYTVFYNLDFKVKKKDVLYLKGPNGSGKSSLLKVMAGLLPPTSGQFSWYGEDTKIVGDNIKQQIHYVGHQDPVKGSLSVMENLRFWASLRRPCTEAMDLPSALKIFNLQELSDLPASFLSTGQKRQLNLTRLSIWPADLWLLDEPFNFLDETASKTLTDAIIAQRKRGGMIVIATHENNGHVGRSLNLSTFSLAQPNHNNNGIKE